MVFPLKRLPLVMAMLIQEKKQRADPELPKGIPFGHRSG